MGGRTTRDIGSKGPSFLILGLMRRRQWFVVLFCVLCTLVCTRARVEKESTEEYCTRVSFPNEGRANNINDTVETIVNCSIE